VRTIESTSVITETPALVVARTVRADRLRIVATLTRITGDWNLAEDCFQDAIERALDRWQSDGVPDNPAAWITTAARNRALDVLRRRQTEHDKLQKVHTLARIGDSPDAGDDAENNIDDQLRLLFMCCHPALPLPGRVALTLKTVTGLSTREVARAFLVSEATMGQRLLRVRNKITNAGISFRLPPAHRMAERTAGVLSVVYLLFNEGYAATEGEPFRDELSLEAIRLADLLTELLPLDDEVHALRALLCFQNARRAARVDADGELVTMEEQDRSRWDTAQIASGLDSLILARALGAEPGYYRLQAEIAALHATALDAASTDWVRIVAMFDALVDLHASPVISLNRTIAVGFRDGPDAGLALLADLEATGDLAEYPLLPAVRADFLRRANRPKEAVAAYRQAISTAGTEAERRLLLRKLHEIAPLD
jgi:RNA polymerase sigma-70 factor (ECF subfamily)